MFSCRAFAFTAIVILFTALFSNAQTKKSKYEVGAAIGGFIYQGDLSPSVFGSYKTIWPGLIIQGTRYLNSTFAARLNFSLASLSGDDSKYSTPVYHQYRNFNFKTRLIELSPQIVWSPTGWNEVGAKISPYAFAGVGLGLVRIRRDWSGFNASHFGANENLPARIAEDMAHSTPRFLPSIPVGAGLRYAVSPRIVINGEVSYRQLFTDYLDGFSKAANPKFKDHYYNIAIGVIYRFGRKNSWDCPNVNY